MLSYSVSLRHLSFMHRHYTYLYIDYVYIDIYAYIIYYSVCFNPNLFIYISPCPNLPFCSVQFSRSVVSDSVTPWTAARQASLSITNSRSSLTLMSIYSVMPSNHLILCHSLLLLPSVFPSIRVFSNESVVHISWPKC